jgi:small acid-soluble spore protein (thioredoxin-like protein)
MWEEETWEIIQDLIPMTGGIMWNESNTTLGKPSKNMKRAEDMIQITDDEKTKQDLIEKNERRRDALKGMREEIREEAIARKNNYQ